MDNRRFKFHAMNEAAYKQFTDALADSKEWTSLDEVSIPLKSDPNISVTCRIIDMSNDDKIEKENNE